MGKRKLDPEKIRERRRKYLEMMEHALAKLRKRHAGFTELVKEYTSFDDFMSDWHEKMTLFGVEVYECSDSIDIRIEIDYTDYEEYYVIMGQDGHLTMSAAVSWQFMCANTLTDIFTGESVEGDAIVNCYPPVSDSDNL